MFFRFPTFHPDTKNQFTNLALSSPDGMWEISQDTGRQGENDHKKENKLR